MIREKYLQECANSYLAKTYESLDSCDIEFISCIIDAFEAGAKWADANPKSPWISVEDDLPSNHEDMYQMSGSLLYTDDVLVLVGNMVLASRRLATCMMFDDSTGKWKWNTPFHVKHWMRIPKLKG